MNRTIKPQVQVEAGIVRGVPRDDHGVLAFKGIPYAAPPVGDLRWHAPQPPQAWAGVRDATLFGARCWSAWQNDPTPWPPQSEDCLSLNIWTAAQHAYEKQPVMVWIHGGGFEFGTSADPSTDGARLAQRGVRMVVCFRMDQDAARSSRAWDCCLVFAFCVRASFTSGSTSSRFFTVHHRFKVVSPECILLTGTIIEYW